MKHVKYKKKKGGFSFLALMWKILIKPNFLILYRSCGRRLMSASSSVDKNKWRYVLLVSLTHFVTSLHGLVSAEASRKKNPAADMADKRIRVKEVIPIKRWQHLKPNRHRSPRICLNEPTQHFRPEPAIILTFLRFSLLLPYVCLYFRIPYTTVLPICLLVIITPDLSCQHCVDGAWFMRRGTQLTMFTIRRPIIASTELGVMDAVCVHSYPTFWHVYRAFAIRFQPLCDKQIEVISALFDSWLWVGCLTRSPFDAGLHDHTV